MKFTVSYKMDGLHNSLDFMRSVRSLNFPLIHNVLIAHYRDSVDCIRYTTNFSLIHDVFDLKLNVVSICFIFRHH